MTFWKKKKKISSNILGTSENKNKEQMNLWETVANIQLRGLEQGSPDGCFRGSSDKTQNSSTTTEQEMWRQQQLLTLSTGLLNVKFSPVFPSQILTMIVFIINQSSCREGKKPFPCAATTADGETHPYLVTQQQQQGFWSPKSGVHSTCSHMGSQITDPEPVVGCVLAPGRLYLTDSNLKTPTLAPLNVNFSGLRIFAYIFLYMERSLFLFMWVDVLCRFSQ